MRRGPGRLDVTQCAIGPHAAAFRFEGNAGNLDDVTLRVLAELREADVVLAEDTRHTRGLLDRHGHHGVDVTGEIHLTSYAFAA